MTGRGHSKCRTGSHRGALGRRQVLLPSTLHPQELRASKMTDVRSCLRLPGHRAIALELTSKRSPRTRYARHDRTDRNLKNNGDLSVFQFFDIAEQDHFEQGWR